jgi:hypothetical protein
MENFVADTVAKIDDLVEYHKTVKTPMAGQSWPWSFLSSIRKQCASSRRELSSKQQACLDSIFEKWSPAAFEKRAQLANEWKEKFNKDEAIQNQARWMIDSLNAQALIELYSSARYYNKPCDRSVVLKTGFWTKARKSYDVDGFISQASFERMSGNKFSKSLIGAMEAPQKFEAGQLVALRSKVFRSFVQGYAGQKVTCDKYALLNDLWTPFKSGSEHIGPQVHMPSSGEQIASKSRQRELVAKVMEGPQVGMVIDVNPVPSLSNAAGCRTYKIMPVGPLQKAAPMLIFEERHLKKSA